MGTKVLERFAGQDEACQWLLDLLTDRGPSPVPATSEEVAALLHGSDDIQRRAREDFQRALARARRRAEADDDRDDRTEPPPTG